MTVGLLRCAWGLAALASIAGCAAKTPFPTQGHWWGDARSEVRVCLPVFSDDKPLRGAEADAWVTGVSKFDQLDMVAAMAQLVQAGEHPATEAAKAAVGLISVGPGDDASKYVERIEALYEAHPDEPCLGQLAALGALATQRIDVAKERIEKAYAAAPDDPDIALTRAMLQDSESDPAATVDAALAKHPNHAPLRVFRAELHRYSGEYAQAIPHLVVARDQGWDIGGRLLKTAWQAADFPTYLREASRLGMPLGDGGSLASSDDPVADFAALLGIGPGQTLHATLKTTLGDIDCTLMPDLAPVTVANFVGLARGTQPWSDPETGESRSGPLYDGTVFHRVIPNFMIQGGDPTGTGAGSPGYRFMDETSAGIGFGGPGVLAMANSGPGTNGSQFFITDAPTPHLNGRHTIFGVCDEAGQQVVAAIASVPRGERDKPVDDVVLERVVIEAR